MFQLLPVKPGAYGDGGLIISNSSEYSEKISMLRNHEAIAVITMILLDLIAD